MSDSEDDCPRLSRETLTALQEFYTQQAEKDKKFRSILAGKESSLQRIQFDEDWVCHYAVFCNIWPSSCRGYYSHEHIRLPGVTELALEVVPRNTDLT